MTLERRNPLPPGRYWMSLLGEQSQEFTAGVKGLNASHPDLVRIVATNHHDANETGNNEAAYDWVLFTVGGNGAVWDHDLIGTPNIAGPEITQESDTIQRPAPEKDVLDKLSDALPSADELKKAAAEQIRTLIIGALVIAGLTALFRVYLKEKPGARGARGAPLGAK
jgi:hypothetical protein